MIELQPRLKKNNNGDSVTVVTDGREYSGDGVTVMMCGTLSLTWGLVITNPGKNNFEVVKLCENGICLKCAVIHSYKDSVFFV